MPRKTTKAEAKIIDYIHRAGEGQGGKHAIIDYMALVEGYSESYVEMRLHALARDGLLERYGGEGSSESTYSINYNDADWDLT